MMVSQAIVVEQDHIRPTAAVQQIALFGPDGKPLIFKNDDSSKVLSTLKGRVTKLEKRIKALEGK